MNAETTPPTWTYGTSWIGFDLVLVRDTWRIRPPGQHSIGVLLEEIRRALDAGLFYLAVMLTLALPDICGALESKDGRAHPSRYKRWYIDNVAHLFEPMVADDCYSLRCGVLHQGRSEIVSKALPYGRVIFMLPNSFGGS